jgi:hypothetical protein
MIKTLGPCGQIEKTKTIENEFAHPPKRCNVLRMVQPGQ